MTRTAAALLLALVTTTAAPLRPATAQVLRGPDVPVARPGQPSVMTGWKDEHRARVLGTLVPGLGHVYAEEFSHGRDVFALSVTGLLGATLAALLAPEAENKASNTAFGVGFAAIGIGAWVWSAVDAPRAARRTNAKRILHRGVGVSPWVGTAPGGALVLGVSRSL
jgi:hypothetical protein